MYNISNVVVVAAAVVVVFLVNKKYLRNCHFNRAMEQY